MKSGQCCSLLMTLVATVLLLFVLDSARAYNPEKYGAIGWQMMHGGGMGGGYGGYGGGYPMMGYGGYGGGYPMMGGYGGYGYGRR